MPVPLADPADPDPARVDACGTPVVVGLGVKVMVGGSVLVLVGVIVGERVLVEVLVGVEVAVEVAVKVGLQVLPGYPQGVLVEVEVAVAETSDKIDMVIFFEQSQARKDKVVKVKRKKRLILFIKTPFNRIGPKIFHNSLSQPVIPQAASTQPLNPQKENEFRPIEDLSSSLFVPSGSRRGQGLPGLTFYRLVVKNDRAGTECFRF